MAKTIQFTTMLHRTTNRITRVLLYAFLEWTLICFILINSIFSLLILKFARYFGLKPPCFLCSRIDHHFFNKPSNERSSLSYEDIICEQHAVEISRTGYCSNHRKLVESKKSGLCQDCKENDDHDALFWVGGDDFGVRKCSCCDGVIEFEQPSVVIKHRDLLGCESDHQFGYEALDHDDQEEQDKEEKEPLLNEVDEEQDVINDNDEDMVVVDRNLSPDMLPQHLEFYIDHDDYRLIPVDLVKKVGNEDNCNDFELVIEGDELVSKSDLQCVTEEEDEQGENDRLCEDASEGESRDVERLSVKDDGDREAISSEEETPVLEEQEEDERRENGSQTLYECQEDNKVDEMSLQNCKEEKIEMKNVGVSQVNEEENHEANESIQIPSNTREYVEEDNASNMRSVELIDAERNEDETHENKHESLSINDHVVSEVSTSSAHLPSVDEHDGKQTEEALNGNVDLPHNEEEQEESYTVAEHVVPEVSASSTYLPSVDEHETKQTEITERSLSVNVNLSQDEAEEERIPDTPTSSESINHLHKKLLLLGRRESTTEESLDGIMTAELDSTENGFATIIENMKAELQSERKALRALYKELEEERNAAEIAANHTMAMITRLQEEKATIEMEALQYQRMMEEQSEYDQEALQMMNELMVKREKEKHELEREVEVYRKKVLEYEEKERERVRALCRTRRHSSASCSDDEVSSSAISPHSLENGEKGHQDSTPSEAVLSLQESLLGFEEERNAILEQLKGLEEKLFSLAEEEEHEENGGENGCSHENGKHELEKRINGSMPKRLLPLFDATELETTDGEFDEEEEGFDATALKKPPVAKFELEKRRAAIEEEVDHVYERLHALEADREFLKHCVGSLRKGDKGLDLLQEILQHLRDLKSVELQAMKNVDHCASV